MVPLLIKYHGESILDVANSDKQTPRDLLQSNTEWIQSTKRESLEESILKERENAQNRGWESKIEIAAAEDSHDVGAFLSYEYSLPTQGSLWEWETNSLIDKEKCMTEDEWIEYIRISMEKKRSRTVLPNVKPRAKTETETIESVGIQSTQLQSERILDPEITIGFVIFLLFFFLSHRFQFFLWRLKKFFLMNKKYIFVQILIRDAITQYLRHWQLFREKISLNCEPEAEVMLPFPPHINASGNIAMSKSIDSVEISSFVKFFRLAATFFVENSTPSTASPYSNHSLTRRYLREELLRWHPDKLQQYCRGKISDLQLKRVCDAANIITQAINEATKELF